MMDLTRAKLLEITDKPIIDEYLKNYAPIISELTFTNLFIWRYYYNFSFMEYNDHLLIFSKTLFKEHKECRSKNPETIFFMPPVGPNPTDVIAELFNDIKQVEVHRVPETIITELETNQKKFPTYIQWEEDRDNWDYVYEKENLITLAGRNLYRKRRWLNRFNKNYPQHEFHLFSEEWLEICKQLQIEWCNMNECRMHEDLVEEKRAIAEAFDNYADLNYRGGLLIIDEKCIAYTLGELLNPSTVVIHIEKALVDYQGSYQAINQHFAKNCCEEVSYINREQDLGDAGLRQAKETYIPHHMGKKYIIYERKI